MTATSRCSTPTNTLSYSLAHQVVLSKIKKALGLDRCITFVSAAAPIALDVVKYFMSLDIPVMEVSPCPL